jgi:hypothetical protein
LDGTVRVTRADGVTGALHAKTTLHFDGPISCLKILCDDQGRDVDSDEEDEETEDDRIRRRREYREEAAKKEYSWSHPSWRPQRLLLPASRRGSVDLLVGGGQGYVASLDLKSLFWDRTRGGPDGVGVRNLYQDIREPVLSLARADVTLDGVQEVIAGTASGRILALSAAAAEKPPGGPPSGYPSAGGGGIPQQQQSEAEAPTNSSSSSSSSSNPNKGDWGVAWQRNVLHPVVCLHAGVDIDGDGLEELVAVSEHGAHLFRHDPEAVITRVECLAKIANDLDVLREAMGMARKSKPTAIAPPADPPERRKEQARATN